MKKTVLLPRKKMSGFVSGLKRQTLFGFALSLAVLPSIGFAQTVWTGSVNNNWDNLSNWSADPTGGAAQILITNNFPVITANNTVIPNDCDLANATGTTGRVDVVSGTLNYNYWSFVGDWNGLATLNIADTSTTGGAFTGYGLGSGSYVSAHAADNNNVNVGLYQSTGVINMNTTGHLDAQNLNISPNGQAGSGTFNLDNGTVNISANLQVGSDFYGQGTTSYGYLNISGGSITANIVALGRGDNNGANIHGSIYMTGGTLSSKQWFTMGFAGSATQLSTVTNSGGTINVNTSGGGQLEMTVYDPENAYFEQNSGAVNVDNNAGIVYSTGGNSSGTNTFTQNGGTVTFYSDAGTNVGGTGSINLGNGSSTGLFSYNLNGGTLTVPKIQQTASTARGYFNFNGGTLKPTANNATFLQGLTAANIQAGGAKIDTAGFNVTIGQNLTEDLLSTGGGLTKTGNGTLTLGGGYAYTGTTKVAGGTLSIIPASGIPGSAGNVVVTNATLKVTGNGSPMPANNLTLDNNSTFTADFGSVFSLPVSPAINAVGSLTKGTNIHINVNLSGSGLAAGPVPLITVGSGSVDTNNLVLGSLPLGVQGVLSNDTTTVYLFITSAVHVLSWKGTELDGSTVDTNWDVNISTNWYDPSYTPTTYSQSDIVEFGVNGYAYDGTNHVSVDASVTPSSVTFDTSTPYALTGAGSINGPTGVLLTNYANVSIRNANGYSGGTQIGANSTLSITNDAALGSGGLTLDGTLQMDGNVSSTRSISVSSVSQIGASTGVSATLGGVLDGVGASLTKVDVGAVTLAGNNTYSGNTSVGAGTLNVSGALTNTIVSVGSAASGNASLGISGNLRASYLFVGNAGAAAASVTQTGGNVVASGGGGDNLCIGNFATAYGYYNAAGGTLTANGIAVGGENNTATGGDPNFGVASGNGILEINGAAVKDNGWLVMTRNTAGSIGILNVNSGSLDFSGTGGGLVCNWAASGQTANVNVMGGLVTSTNTGVGLGGAGNGAILNLKGGTVSVTSIGGNFGGIAGVLNFNGGAYKAVGSTAAPFSVNQANVYSGGATIDDGGYTVSSSQPLLAPTGYGVSSVALSDGGSGYIAPPIVTVNGGLGSNATVIASVSAGVITGITVTSPGNNYDVADGAGMYLTFSGGGASAVAPASATITLAANTSGSLTKKGAGTLTLTGVNTYTGTTIVTNGTLVLTPVQQTPTPVVVADGAKLSIAASSTTNGAVIGNLTLGSATGASLGISYGFSGNPTNVALTAGAVTINGASSIKIGGVFNVGVFPLLKYTTLSTLPALEAPRGTTAALTNDTVNGILYVKITAVGGGIVWDGTIGLITNKWDVNITTNWFTGLTPTTYQEATPPGDAVVFNDLGSPTVRVSNSVSPANVVISNSVNYSFGGSGGQINSTLGLTKSGAGTVTLGVPGNYSGNTVLSNGAVAINAAQTFANLAGDSPLSGGSALTVNSSSNTVFAGKIQGSTMTLTKNGNSTLTLSSNYLAGQIQVNAGKMVLTASNALSGDFFVGRNTGSSGQLDLVSGSSLSMPSTWFFVGVDNSTGNLNVSGNASVNGLRLWVGGSSYHDNGIGVANINTTGTITESDGILIGEAWGGGYGNGTLNLTNGTLVSGNELWVGGDANTGSTNYGTLNQYAGSVSSAAWMAIGRCGSGGTVFGTYNVFGGSVTAATSTSGSFLTIGSIAGGTGVMNVSGGSVLVASNRRLYVGEGGNGTLNVSGTGTVTCSNIVATDGLQLGVNGGSVGTVNLDGGTIRAGLVRNGGGSGTWNFNGGTLVALTNMPTFMSGLTAANVRTGGAVINTAGNNVTIAQALLNNGVDQDGGLTKNGNGTLLLSGVNTYTNVTTVNAGGLGGTGTIAGAVVVNSGAGLVPANSGVGVLTINGNLTLNTGSTNVFTVNPATPTNDLVVAGAAVTYGGVLKISSTGTLTPGQQFQLFSGTGATNTGNFASIQSADPAAVFSFTNGVLTVVSYTTINPNPPVMQVSYNGGTGIMSLAWPTNSGWILQSNSVSLIDTNAWHEYPPGGSTSITNVNITVDPSKPSVFFRMLKP